MPFSAPSSQGRRPRPIVPCRDFESRSPRHGGIDRPVLEIPGGMAIRSPWQRIY